MLKLYKINIYEECLNPNCNAGGECAVLEKNPHPPHGRSSEIPRGRGVLNMKLNWSFLRVLGVENKNLLGGGVWMFSGTAQ